MGAAKIRFCTNSPWDLKWCVFCQLRWGQPYLQIWAQYGHFRFWPFWGHQKSELFTTRPVDLKLCVLCWLHWMQANMQIWAQYGDFRFWPIWGQQKCDFSQLVPETSNGAFSVSYADSSLTCKFQLNTAILDFDRSEVTKNPLFQSRPGGFKWCVLSWLRREQHNLQIQYCDQYCDLRFWLSWGQQKSDFSQLVP